MCKPSGESRRSHDPSVRHSPPPSPRVEYPARPIPSPGGPAMRLLLIALAGMSLAAAGPAPSPDYDKVERKLVKEPAYKTKNPRYGLLLFGRAAALRVWAVLDGDT